MDTDVNIDQVNVQNRVAQAQANLPTDVNQYGLTTRKSTGLPMLVISLYSPNRSYDSLFLANYANININDVLYRVPGVGEVRVFGSSDYAMRIWVKPDALVTLGLGVPDLAKAVQQQSNVNPSGQVGGEPAPPGMEKTYTVRAQGRLQTPEEFGEIVVRSNPDGSVVRLKDVARIELGALNYQQSSRVNGQPSAIIAIFQAPGSNALAVAAGIKKTIEELKNRFPNDLDYQISLDTTLPVTQGIREIVQTLIEALILVIIVVFLFLQNWRATLIPIIAVPVSLIGTFAAFPFLGFSINTLSLFAFVLAIGLVVDDAIVVVEAVERHIEEGMAPVDATSQAMKEVSGPVIGIALILSSVFLPIAFMGGIQGRLNEQFALTIAIAVLISAFNALTLSPALAALLLRPKKHRKACSPGSSAASTGGCESDARVRRLEPRADPQGGSGPVVPRAVGVVDAVMSRKLPASFLPEEDYGYAFLNVQLPPAASLARNGSGAEKSRGDSRPDRRGAVLRDGWRIQSADAHLGQLPGFLLRLVQAVGRAAVEALAARAIVDRLNGTLAREVPEAVAFAFMPPSIPGLGNAGGFSLWLQDRSGGSVEFLDQNLQNFLAACRQRPELAGVASQFSADVPQIYADVDRDKALKQGVAIADVYQTLQAYLGGLFLNQFNRFGRQWRVFLQAEGAERKSAEDIRNYYVRNDKGTMVPLSGLVTTRSISGPEYTDRFNLYRAAQVIGGAAPGYSSGQAMAALEAVAKAGPPARDRLRLGRSLISGEASVWDRDAGRLACRWCSCS